jgi:hypothetical protein
MIDPSTLDPNRVYKVRHTFEKDGQNLGHHVSDLQVDDGVVYIVCEWLRTHEGEVPCHRIPLDPRRLHNLGWADADLLYELPVPWPKELPYDRPRSQ